MYRLGQRSNAVLCLCVIEAHRAKRERCCGAILPRLPLCGSEGGRENPGLAKRAPTAWYRDTVISSVRVSTERLHRCCIDLTEERQNWRPDLLCIEARVNACLRQDTARHSQTLLMVLPRAHSKRAPKNRLVQRLHSCCWQRENTLCHLNQKGSHPRFGLTVDLTFLFLVLVLGSGNGRP